MGFPKLEFKKGLSLKSSFFAVIVMGIIVAAVGTTLSEWGTFYENPIPYDLDNYNKIEDVSATAGEQQQALSPNDPDPGTNAEASTFRGGYGIISNIYQPFRIVFGNDGMLDAVTERFGLPDYLRQALVTMMVIAFTFAIVAIVFRLSRSSA